MKLNNFVKTVTLLMLTNQLSFSSAKSRDMDQAIQKHIDLDIGINHLYKSDK